VAIKWQTTKYYHHLDVYLEKKPSLFEFPSEEEQATLVKLSEIQVYLSIETMAAYKLIKNKNPTGSGHWVTDLEMYHHFSCISWEKPSIFEHTSEEERATLVRLSEIQDNHSIGTMAAYKLSKNYNPTGSGL